jgi:hypothetical protein
MTNADATDYLMATMLSRKSSAQSAEMGPVVYGNAARHAGQERQEPGRLSTNDELVSGCW